MASKTKIKSALKALQPEKTKISTALNFLRLVVSNNPGKNAVAINKRKDVQGAEKEILDWYTSVSDVAKDIAALTTSEIGKTITASVGKTLDRMMDDIAITDSNIERWRTSSESRDVWAVRLLVRMKFLLKWLESQLDNLSNAKGKYKVWQSRLAPNTCKYCASLHGTVVLANASFEEAAKKIGWNRSYAGLYVPGLHPGCRCWVKYTDDPKGV